MCIAHLARESFIQKTTYSKRNDPCHLREKPVFRSPSQSLLLFPSQRFLCLHALFPSSLLPLPSPKDWWGFRYLSTGPMNHPLKQGQKWKRRSFAGRILGRMNNGKSWVLEPRRAGMDSLLCHLETDCLGQVIHLIWVTVSLFIKLK